MGTHLERIFCAGEVLNAPAWDWLQNKMLKNRIPVIDHMWQTETGGPIFGNPYGLGMLPIKAGSATIPLPGIEVDVMTMDGESCAPNEKGIMVIKRPFPGRRPPCGVSQNDMVTIIGAKFPMSITREIPLISMKMGTSGSRGAPMKSSRLPVTALERSKWRPPS
jgi:hypothetical protein